MKFLHVSDLHIGKKFENYSIADEQINILKQILECLILEKIEYLLIAGDIFDKAIPSEEAIKIFDDFLNEVINNDITVFIIAGNHDSSVRLAFGDRILKKHKVHIFTKVNGESMKVTVREKENIYNFYLLPNIRLLAVKEYFCDDNIKNRNEAIKRAIENMNIDNSEVNILLAHQFVSGGKLGGSERIIIGGDEMVEADSLKVFDYVALGHLHRAQSVKNERIRYSGSPIKYSFSEISHKKVMLIVEIDGKSNFSVESREFKHIRNLVEIKGYFNDILNNKKFLDEHKEDFISVKLFDDRKPIEGFKILKNLLPRLISFKLFDDNTSDLTSRDLSIISEGNCVKHEEVFFEFFEIINNFSMSEEQVEILSDVIKFIGDNNYETN